ncbi:phage/plasmid primase, P4 family [Fimbriimonas ginsengisoli]|nr:phage/plasmid primase, P4 family [Fimbriimonas ginsengisoli]
MLEIESGIPTELIEQRGYWTATKRVELERLGFGATQQSVPALVIPQCSVGDGHVVRYIVRPDNPRMLSGKWVKYESPRGAAKTLDCHPSQVESLKDPLIPLWIGEGTKKGDCGAAHGLLALNLDGVSAWRGKNDQGGITVLDDWNYIALNNRRVYIAFDSDVMTKWEVREELRKLGEFLSKKGAKVRFVIIPSADGRKVGLDDFFVAGGTVPELIAAAIDRLPNPASPAATLCDKKVYPCTELGNAERLVDAHGADIRYCATTKKWMVWDGRRWLMDDHEGAPVSRLAQGIVRSMYAEASTIADDADRKAFLRWVTISEGKRAIENMLALAKTQPGIAVSLDEFDTQPYLLNLANGTYDLETFVLRPHCRDDKLTRFVDIPFIEDAYCPLWLDFLATIFENDETLMRYIWKACGYSLTGDVSEKCFFYLYGHNGDNGKSVFIRTLLAILGPYGRAMPTSSFLAKRDGSDAANNDIARLKGARVASASEVGEGQRLDEELIKLLTGNDVITARFLYQEHFDFLPEFKVWFTGNYRPIIRGQDRAIWNRPRLIPFNYSVPKEAQDTKLSVKLRAEYPGILAWMIAGCKAWQSEGLGRPDVIAAAVEEYREDMDDLGDFLEQCTTQGKGFSASAHKLYEAFEKWCKMNGMKVMTSTSFGRKLTARGIAKVKTNTGAIYQEIALLSDEALQNVYRGGN